ncbi:MAG: flavin reductase family protein [Bacillota bacterium]|nr:flavin reductase family protein [Bacillota bacterium]
MGKKVSVGPGCMLAPIPAVMATVSSKGKDNIITIAWTGIINSEPPMTYISVKPERHSYKMLKQSREFVINLVPEDLTFAMDHCGVASGANEDKFETMHLTKVPADIVKCPMIKESPVNIECKVVKVEHLGSHDIFMAEIVAIHVDEKLIDKNGRIAFEKAHLVSFVHGEYYGLDTKVLGTFGYSVMKKKTAAKRKASGKPVGSKKPHWKKD